MVRYMSLRDIDDNEQEHVLYYDEDKDIFYYIEDLVYTPRDVNNEAEIESYKIVIYDYSDKHPYWIREQYAKFQYPLNDIISSLVGNIFENRKSVYSSVLDRLEQYTGVNYIEAQNIILYFDSFMNGYFKMYDIETSSYYINIVLDTRINKVVDVTIKIK